MAIVRRRYKAGAPADARLKASVSDTATVVATGAAGVDVEVDDQVPGTVETLDEFMADHGMVLDSANPPTERVVALRSPDGTDFELRVDNAGVLTVVSV